MEGPLLTLEDVLREAEQEGLDLSERTFRYYAVLGLLPRPFKRPSGSEDARVAWYPPDVMPRLREIRSLQSEGYSLKQIKQFFGARANVEETRVEGGTTDGMAPAATSAVGVQAALRALAGRGLAEAGRRFVVEALLHPEEDAFRRFASRYYQDAMALLLGEQAGAAVRDVMTHMTPLELEALWRPLRGWRDAERTRRVESGRRSPTAVGHLKALVAARQARGEAGLDLSGPGDADIEDNERLRQGVLDEARRLGQARQGIEEDLARLSPWTGRLATWAIAALAAVEEGCLTALAPDGDPAAALARIEPAEENLADLLRLLAASERILSRDEGPLEN